MNSAGLCYLFMVLPALFVAFEYFFAWVLQEASSTAAILFQIGCLISACCALCLCFWIDPLIFRVPAIVSCCIVVGVKVVSVFVHTPEVARFSNSLTIIEISVESSLQLNLMLHILLSGGKPPVGAMVSSLLVIGKGSAENYLAAAPENKLKGKPFLQKLRLVSTYIPVFTLTAFFRTGSGVFNVINYYPGYFGPYTVSVSIGIVWVCQTFYFSAFYLLAFLARPLVVSLRSMTMDEVGYNPLMILTTHDF